jgi:hypothetical protein
MSRDLILHCNDSTVDSYFIVRSSTRLDWTGLWSTVYLDFALFLILFIVLDILLCIPLDEQDLAGRTTL